MDKVTSTEPHREIAFDFYRGLAILSVLALHAGATNAHLSEHFGRFFPYFGNLQAGMELFFVISGYVIFGSYRRTPRLGTFYRKRIFRLLPLYYLAAILSIAIYLALKFFLSDFAGFWKNSIRADSFTWQNVFVHIFLLQGVDATAHEHTFLDGSWSLAAEVYYYLLFPALAYLLDLTRTGFILIFLAAAALEYYQIVHPFFPSASTLNLYSMPNLLVNFLLGALLYQVAHRDRERVGNDRTILTAGGIAFFGLVTYVNYRFSGHALENISLISLIAALVALSLRLSAVYAGAFGFFILIALSEFKYQLIGFNDFLGIAWFLIIYSTRQFINRRQNTWMIRSVTDIGVQSYSFYLLHILLMWPISYAIYSFSDRTPFAPLYLLNLTLLFFSTYYLAKHVHRLDQYFIAMGRATRRAAS